jgi:hypothetical protein
MRTPEEILDKSFFENVLKWEQSEFRKRFPVLQKSIIESMKTFAREACMLQRDICYHKVKNEWRHGTLEQRHDLFYIILNTQLPEGLE